MPASPNLSAECVGWARTAGFVCSRDDSAGTVELRSELGAPVSYVVRRRPPDRLELTEVDDQDVERLVLFVAEMSVLERHLFAICGDDIREDLGLPFIELRWDTASLADGYELDDSSLSYQILSATGRGPVAAVPRSDVGLLTLVPLSHFLGWSLGRIETVFSGRGFQPTVVVRRQICTATVRNRAGPGSRKAVIEYRSRHHGRGLCTYAPCRTHARGLGSGCDHPENQCVDQRQSHRRAVRDERLGSACDQAAHLAEFGHLAAVDFIEQCVIEASPGTAPWDELQRRVDVGDFDGWPPVWMANHRGQRLKPLGAA